MIPLRLSVHSGRECYSVDDNIAAAVANGWEVSYDAATETFTYKTTYTGEKLVVPTVDWALTI
ncbi:hypothetical protein OQG81_03450 [Streptococcus macedonicus]|uniref:Uncharacterized protein n=1 Tax=Streptococcus macedonicus TaxID=59310 RepID=A0AA47IMR0_STRMC|nr:hypothetical protein [Streptococcus macedonicus]WAK63926.1 hypothetical protein OQG81_03450 [Streptococcus macedonicus]